MQSASIKVLGSARLELLLVENAPALALARGRSPLVVLHFTLDLGQHRLYKRLLRGKFMAEQSQVFVDNIRIINEW